MKAKRAWAIFNKGNLQHYHDAYAIYKAIKPFVVKPNFYQLKSTYTVIQLNINKNITGFY